jgi:hypothetical protein
MGGRDGSRCFCCFATKLSAGDVPVSTEIQGTDGSAMWKTARLPTVPPLFFAVFVIQM